MLCHCNREVIAGDNNLWLTVDGMLSGMNNLYRIHSNAVTIWPVKMLRARAWRTIQINMAMSWMLFTLTGFTRNSRRYG
ncbi:hypothetical Protein YC6258_01438 [Gynuella sunshinyii YC6258]|uniref:Uncharacterized protein n=1 Tax=Gynuella sunshinyii YC6258 TaxID=1445510 RepID=A0A0C5VGY2_9GAMM|nr:hypothetical Protein YC6258_01438 [Gynuella sunshinyii YC6258]